MATARIAIGSVLGSVNSVATTVGSTFDTITKAVDMGNELVTNASKQQKIRNRIQSVDYTKRIIQECAVATATREVEINKVVSNDPLFKSFYEENVKLYEASLSDDNKD